MPQQHMYPCVHLSFTVLRTSGAPPADGLAAYDVRHFPCPPLPPIRLPPSPRICAPSRATDVSDNKGEGSGTMGRLLEKQRACVSPMMPAGLLARVTQPACPSSCGASPSKRPQTRRRQDLGGRTTYAPPGADGTGRREVGHVR